MPGKYNLSAHKTARRARKIVAFYGNEPAWLGRLIRSELKIQSKIMASKKPGTSDYAIAQQRVIECENVLSRFVGGKIEWEPIEGNDKEQR